MNKTLEMITVLLAAGAIAAGCGESKKKVDAQPVKPTYTKKTEEAAKQDESKINITDNNVAPLTNVTIDKKEIAPNQLAKENSYTVIKYDLKIPGTYTVDIDSATAGKVGNAADIFWEQINQTERMLRPRNGASLAYLGNVDFEKLSLNDLINAEYSANPVSGSDNDNKLVPGTVIGIKTNEGNYAALLITGNVPLKFPGREYKFYDIESRVRLYQKK